jgi:3-dehydroquinate dehydratase
MSKKTEIHFLYGVNLNMQGYCDVEYYGNETLEEISKKITDFSKKISKDTGQKISLKFYHSNSESEMINYIHSLVLGVNEKGLLSGLVFNFSSWTYTSIALRDAVYMLKPTPLVEVTLAQVTEDPVDDEEVRQYSLFEDIVDYRVVGNGNDGYMDALKWILTESKKERPDLH